MVSVLLVDSAPTARTTSWLARRSGMTAGSDDGVYCPRPIVPMITAAVPNKAKVPA